MKSPDHRRSLARRDTPSRDDENGEQVRPAADTAITAVMRFSVPGFDLTARDRELLLFVPQNLRTCILRVATKAVSSTFQIFADLLKRRSSVFRWSPLPKTISTCPLFSEASFASSLFIYHYSSNGMYDLYISTVLSSYILDAHRP